MSLIPQSIAALTATASFILVGNAITQSYMTIPCLTTLFPAPAPSPSAHATRLALLAAQWKHMHAIGNAFFRPLSTLAAAGYALTAQRAFAGALRGDWRLFALAAACHVANVVYSAVRLQPINARLDRIGELGAVGKDGGPGEDAVALAERWRKCNLWRIAFPMVAGSVTLWQAFLLGL